MSKDNSNMSMEEIDLQESSENILIDEFDDFWKPSILKNELENELSRYIVAKIENDIVGFAGIIILPDDAEITNIVTRKQNRKNGIGKLLLAKLIEITKQENKEEISLEVNEINKPAIKLYESFGFEIVGRRKKYYNRENDAIIMTKKLV